MSLEAVTTLQSFFGMMPDATWKSQSSLVTFSYFPFSPPTCANSLFQLPMRRDSLTVLYMPYEIKELF